MYWLSKRTRNDLFLLNCFADSGRSTEELRAAIAERSERIADLRVRLRELPADIDYPSWTPCEFATEQFIEHQLPEPSWTHLLDALGNVLGTAVDAAARPWRLHVFRGIVDAPGAGNGAALVAVLQMSHALADGRRASAIARALFSGSVVDEGVPSGDSRRSGSVVRGSNAGVDGGQAGDVSAIASGGRGAPAKRRPAAGDHVAAVDGGATRSTGGVNSGASTRSSNLFTRGRQTGSALAGALGIRSAVSGRGREISAGLLFDSALGLLRLPVGLASTAVRGYQAFQAQRQLAQLTEAGQLPPPGPGFPPTLVNRSVAEGISRHDVRMLVFPAEDLRVPDRTVTVVVLTAVSVALARYLANRGEPVQRLGAQVPMALPEPPTGDDTRPRNNYRSLGVDLFADEPDLRLRADKIAAELAERRLRAKHPLLSAQDRVTATVPAPLLRRDVDHYPLDAVPDSIAGHTVVSSVDRGPADLVFGGGPVRFTAGFPALGSVMHLTHGVHGLGAAVTVSLHADSAVVPDVDAYAGLLRVAMKEVTDAL